jgi:hypothetical protein
MAGQNFKIQEATRAAVREYVKKHMDGDYSLDQVAVYVENQVHIKPRPNTIKRYLEDMDKRYQKGRWVEQ